jgi:bis(5'-nucleosyl)-tetraphosphatase (symmetrical)
MTTYAVGDIQGCLDPLLCLLDEVGFDPAVDTLWSVGDCINRGPRCLDTLRFLYDMRDSLVMVLGNHDLHLIAAAAGVRQPSRSDTLDAILEAPDSADMVEWLTTLPLLHHEHGHTLVHAGIAPQWDLAKASALADEVAAALRGRKRKKYLAAMYGNTPARWSDSLTGMTRLRVITNYFTRMRFCSADGTLDLDNKTGVARGAMKPWFSHPKRKMRGQPIIFGHWAALYGATRRPDAIGLDTGCVWNGAMTLYNLDTGRRTFCYCHEGRAAR